MTAHMTGTRDECPDPSYSRGAIRHESGNVAILGEWLGLAAAPTFAVMALLTGGFGDGGRMAMLCSTAQDASPLSGMAAMYLLMSAFHSAPWLKLISSRRGNAFRRSS